LDSPLNLSVGDDVSVGFGDSALAMVGVGVRT
jgi:sugar (pentulose or hexulose) kinase